MMTKVMVHNTNAKAQLKTRWVHDKLFKVGGGSKAKRRRTIVRGIKERIRKVFIIFKIISTEVRFGCVERFWCAQR